MVQEIKAILIKYNALFILCSIQQRRVVLKILDHGLRGYWLP